MTAGIVIIGGGLSGLAAAIVLAGRGFDVTLLDSGDGGLGDTIRTTTLNPFAYGALESAGIAHKDSVAKVMAIRVSDDGNKADDHLLGWEAEDDDTPLAFVARNSVLLEKAKALAGESPAITIHHNIRITALEEAGDHALRLTDENGGSAPGGGTWEASLVLACDGAGSALREMAGIKTIPRDPGQTAIVADVATGRPHDNTAWQRFCDSNTIDGVGGGGPLALMPLPGDDKSMSLVWTMKTADAEKLLADDDAAFSRNLTGRASSPFGDLTVKSPRRHWEIKLTHALRPYANRLLLIGDAAHAIHPLAGQGFNLAMGDIVALAASLEWARDRGSDYGSDGVLKHHARRRAAEVAAMTLATDGLNALFASAPPQLRGLAASAMAVLDKTPLKTLAKDFATRGFNRP